MRLHIDEKPKVGPLRFSTYLSDYSETTSPRSILKQSGMEFDHFRPYRPDHDDARYIDWIASARVDDTLVRVFSENTVLNVLLMLDVSESMIYGTVSKAKIEYAIELVINLAFGILAYGDSVSLIIYNDDVVTYVPFAVGDRQFATIKDVILQNKTYGGELDFSKATAFAVEKMKNTHLMIMISDFLGYGRTLFDNIEFIAHHFDILGIMVHDKRDLTLKDAPRNAVFSDPYSDEFEGVALKKVVEHYEEANKARIKDIQNFFMAIEKDFWTLSTEDSIKKRIPELLVTRSELK